MKTRNIKYEILNKLEVRSTKRTHSRFLISNFGFVSNFEFQFSNFISKGDL